MKFYFKKIMCSEKGIDHSRVPMQQSMVLSFPHMGRMTELRSSSLVVPQSHQFGPQSSFLKDFKIL